MVFAGPQPSQGQPAQVNVDGIDITVQPGKYAVIEADRFGQKISTGDLRYDDFNPFESAETPSNLTGGAGLRRYSDKPNSSGTDVALMYKETSNVNASGIPTILSPLQNLESLPSSTSPAVWAGEFTPSSGALSGITQFVAVAGTKVYRRLGTGSWSDTGIVLAAPAVKGAVTAFLGTLIIGYGSAATAQATTDLVAVATVTQTIGPTAIFIFAATSDRASSYVAGGTATTNSNQILSSTAAATGYGSPVATGNGAITALAPGGGISIVYIGKTSELGEIDANGIYRTLVPFDSSLASNCNPLKWWMGSGESQQRGPVVLTFPRERGLWTYVPSTVSSGSIYNISPWADPVIRPPNARGAVTAMQGTARWLYFSTVSGTGRCFIWRRDASTGNSHTWVDMGINACQTLAITSLFGTNPLLFIGTGNNITSVTLPLDGDNEVDDPACRFCSTGTLDYADVDLGFPDEDKIAFTVRVVADDLVAGAQQIDIQTAADNGAFIDLGTVSASPSGQVSFVGTVVAKRIAVRAILTTNDPTKTPKLLAISVRVSLNTKLYKIWQFTGTLGVGSSLGFGGANLQNPQDAINKLWADRAAGIPITFRDRWNDIYSVRILKMEEQQLERRIEKFLDTMVTMTLLFVSKSVSGLVYDSPTALYDAPTSVYS